MRKTARPTAGQQGARSPEPPAFRDGKEFEALSDAEKERVWRSYNRRIPLPETRPLSPADRARHRLARRNGRAAAANGNVGRVSVTIDRGLLQRADAFAANGTSRSELVARGLEAVIGGK